MERISAARAMEWSIELEKGLRSKKPGRAVEAILDIGPRLEQWNAEPQLTMAAYNMFGLVPGEDRLFANTILLRLADAFRLGEKHTKLSVVKVFLSELRHRTRNKKKRRRYNGILSKCKVDNHCELLRRVKFVFDNGDAESRALSLVLFGCWADFANDSADIRYLILSSLVSSHVLEVKASLFAAGCFCELSEDFASIVLEILSNMVTSSKILAAVRVAGVRALAKMGTSSSLTNRAYKIGIKLLPDSSEEDFLVAMLVSLSKLASKSALLISEQVELLYTFLIQETTLHMQAMALRCLHFVLVRGVSNIPVSPQLIRTLFSMIDEPKFSSALQCEALWILHKILLYSLPDKPFMEMLEFSKLLTIVENASQSPIMSKRLLAITVLVNISAKARERMETESGEVCSTSLASRVISLAVGQMTLLVKQVLEFPQADSEVERKGKRLLNLILFLVEEHPNLGILVLENVYIFIENMVNMHDRLVAKIQPDLLVHGILEYKEEKSTSMGSKFMFYVFKFMVSCLEILNEAAAITTQVLHKVKLMVKHVHQCSFFDWYTHTIYSLLLHSHIVWDWMANENEVTHTLDRNLDLSPHGELVEHEIVTLDCAKMMLAEKDNWSAYRAGKYAAYHGAWLAATFIFEQLISEVQSHSCYCWLKFLAQFAHSEREIQLLFLPKLRSTLVNWLEANKIFIIPSRDDLGEIAQDAAENFNSPNYCEKLVRAYLSLCSSENTLDAIVTSSEAFYFQRWFLALRIKLLKTVLDILKIVGTFPLNQDDVSGSGDVERSNIVDGSKLLQQNNSLYSLTQISFQLKRLAQEFDLITTSFVGMDRKSLKIISALALSCSLLAFSTGFALFIPNLAAHGNFTNCGLEKLNSSPAMLVQNLVSRLSHIDHETSANLRLLLKVSGNHKSSFHLLSRNQILSIGCEAREILRVCSYAVVGVIRLQNETNRVHNEEILSQAVKDGLKLLSDIIKKWIHIPFRTPMYFFQVRPCIGAELFAFNTNSRNPDSVSVLPGFHLSLNLCLQLKNVQPNLPVRLSKLYCILYCKTSFQMPRSSGEKKGQTWLGCRAWENDDMVDLNEKLLQYVIDRTKKTTGKRCRNGKNDGGILNACVCFESNERGQGFSTCLLDVSGFPVGSYRIKWLSCCIDNQGSYRSLLPLNPGPVFSVQKSVCVG